MAGRPYTLAGKTFPSKVALTAAVREEIETWPMGLPFPSLLLRDLILKHHHACSRLDLSLWCFTKVKPKESSHSGAYELEALFSSYEWTGWHDVSWRKCIYPISYDDEVKAFFRARIAESMRDARQAACQACGDIHGPFEVDHVNPTFEEIYQAARQEFTQEEIDGWAHHDWLNNRRFALPETHPVVIRFDALHATAPIQTLCRSCHTTKTQQQRTASHV